MKRALLCSLFPAMTLTACVSFSTSPPPRVEAPITEVLRKARDNNWVVRVHSDSVSEGRVTFVQGNAARVGRDLVQFDRITRIERRYESQLGGKRTGFFIGAGIGAVFGYLLGTFTHQMSEVGGSCRACPFYMLLSGGIFGTMGALFGSMVDPPTQTWTAIWEK